MDAKKEDQKQQNNIAQQKRRQNIKGERIHKGLKTFKIKYGKEKVESQYKWKPKNQIKIKTINQQIRGKVVWMRQNLDERFDE